jgi:uncharacterized protein YdaU (DUF1376 family)
VKKETFYFSHDYTARSDEKIKNLLYNLGYEGYGIYWALIEELYQNANALRKQYKRIAFDMRVDEKTIQSVIEDFELFVIDDEFFGSLSVQRRIELRDEKSKKASDSAKARWSKDANALRTQSDSNAIKESKVNETKINETKIKENKELTIVSGEPSIEDIFEFFWNAYQKKGNKQTSLTAFKRLTKTQMIEIRAHIPKYLENHHRNGKMQFLPHFSSYLNKKIWLDQLPYEDKKEKINSWGV